MADAEYELQRAKCTHDSIAKACKALWNGQYYYIDKWWKWSGKEWETGPAVVYELLNRLSDEMPQAIQSANSRRDEQRYNELQEIEFMLETHEEKRNILKEMEARFYVKELPASPTFRLPNSGVTVPITTQPYKIPPPPTPPTMPSPPKLMQGMKGPRGKN